MVTVNSTNELRDYLKINRKKLQKFRVAPVYSPEGDTLTVFFKPDRCRAERMGQLLTVYLSEQTNELVGCKVKGVSLLADNITATSINVNKNDVCQFRMILGATGAVERRDYFYELVKQVGDIAITLSSFVPANSNSTSTVCV